MADETNGTPTPPEVQPQPAAAAADPSLTGPAGAPTAPPKESFGGGFKRGAQGEQYFVDAQGNMTNARRTGTSAKGTFGSILAGVVFGALAGAHNARPGGIPSHELGGGAGAGAAGAEEFFQKRDERNRGRAQGDFTRGQEVKEATNKDLMYKANIHIANLNEIKLAHEIGEAKINDPIHHQQLVNATEQGQLALEAEVKNLGLLNEREYEDYQHVPKADIDKFNRHEVKLMTLPNGKVKVWDRTFDPRATPNTTDFEMKDLVGLGGNGKPEWKTVGHVKAGAGTVAQQEAEIDKQRTQLLDAATKNATAEKEKSETAKNYSTVRLNDAQAKLMGTLGVNVPAGYKPPDNLFSMDEVGNKDALTKSGVTPAPDHSAMYAIGHYDADLKSLPTMLRKGVTQRDRSAALTYIRTFINPNYDEKNYDAVKQLEKEFASTKSGTAGGNLMSFGAAVGHLNSLYELSQANGMGKSGLPIINRIANEWAEQTGQAAPKSYDGIRSVLVGEVGRLLKQAAPDVKEMAELSAALDRANSPEAFKGVTNTFAHAFLTKGEQAIQQYYNYTGKLPPSTFSPKTLKALQNMGVDVSDAFPQGAQVSVGGTGNQNPQQPNQPVKAADVPPAVANLLKGLGPGRHTLTDGSVWDKLEDGSVKKAQ